MKLKNHIAIISGGLGDIGRAIAIELGRQGAAVGLGDLQPSSKAKPFLRQLKKQGVPSIYTRMNVADPKSVNRWIQITQKTLGVINLIIVNAGTVTMDTFKTLTPEKWRRVLSVNLDGAYYTAIAPVKRLVQLKKPGRVVFIGSWAGHVPHIHIPSYCVSKAGLRMLCQLMAAEYAASGILINEVAPGYVEAGLAKMFFKKDARAKRQQKKRVPIKKLIQPEEVARHVAYLCDPENVHMTGSTLLMDGGLSLKTLNP